MNIHFNINKTVAFYTLNDGDFFVASGYLYRKYSDGTAYSFEKNLLVGFHAQLVYRVDVEIQVNDISHCPNLDQDDFDDEPCKCMGCPVL